MLKFNRILLFLFLIINAFQPNLQAKISTPKKIAKKYGGYNFHAEYILSTAHNKKPLRVKLSVGRGTHMMMFKHGLIGPDAFTVRPTLYFHRKPLSFDRFSTNHMKTQLDLLAHNSPSALKEAIQNFLTMSFSKYSDCDSFFMSQLASHYPFPHSKSLPLTYTIRPKKNACLRTYFKFFEYNPIEKKIIRSFFGSVVIFNKISTKGKKITIVKAFRSNSNYKKSTTPSITMTYANGKVKKIQKVKIKNFSTWYPHILEHMKWSLKNGAIFFIAHEHMAEHT